jgi:hypothetical protein
MKSPSLYQLVLVAAVILAAREAQAAALFSENFENDLSQWTGQDYGSYQAAIVPDPLRVGNHVVSFNGTSLGGDIFSVPAITLTEGQHYSFSLEYLGQAVANSIPGNFGGFAGLNDVVMPYPEYRNEPARDACWIFATQADYPLVRQQLIDDGQWRTYTYDFVWQRSEIDALYDTIHVMLEDFYDSGNTVGDVFFDNIQLVAVSNASIWKGPGDGSFNQASNWTNNLVPNSVDATASFLGNITASSTVTLDSPVTLGIVNFDSTPSYTLAGTGTITFQASSGNASLNVISGNHQIGVPVVINSDTVISGGGTLELSGGITGNHALTILTNVSATSIQVDSLTIGAMGATAVPEPSTIALVGMCALGLLGWAWWRKS